MNVLLFGHDCGTHAMAWKIFNSPLVDEVLCSPGNGGTSLFAPSAAVAAGDAAAVIRFVLGENIQLIVADQDAITAGVADEAAAIHRPVFNKPDEQHGGRVLVQEWLPGPLVTVSALAGAGQVYAVPTVRLHQLSSDPWSPVVGAHRGVTRIWSRLEDRLQESVCRPLVDALWANGAHECGWIGVDCRVAARGPVIERLRSQPQPLEAACCCRSSKAMS